MRLIPMARDNPSKVIIYNLQLHMGQAFFRDLEHATSNPTLVKSDHGNRHGGCKLFSLKFNTLS